MSTGPAAAPASTKPADEGGGDRPNTLLCVDKTGSSRRPRSEIRDSHLAAQNECGGAREQPDHDQRPSYDFQGSGESTQCAEVVVDPASRKAPELLRAMLKEEQPNGDPRDAPIEVA